MLAIHTAIILQVEASQEIAMTQSKRHRPTTNQPLIQLPNQQTTKRIELSLFSSCTRGQVEKGTTYLLPKRWVNLDIYVMAPYYLAAFAALICSISVNGFVSPTASRVNNVASSYNMADTAVADDVAIAAENIR